MGELIHYNPVVALAPGHTDLPGLKAFSRYFSFFNNANSAVIDRTGTLRTPVRTRSLFPLPGMRPFAKTLEEVCDARARDLLARAEKLDTSLYVMWSGGIDSTLVLVSLLKNASPEQRARLVVLMTEESILENRNFYEKFIRGTLRADATDSVRYLLGTDVMIVGGEGNDQLFGAGPMQRVINRFGGAALHKPYSRDLYREIFSENSTDPKLVDFYLDTCEKICAAAPMEIRTNADFAWYEKFCIKWQSNYFRLLACASPSVVPKLTKVWIEARYDHFYMTDDFQLWSMNNLDKRIKDTWKSYKWPCKDIIYDFTKDADYRDNKTKRGSLELVFRMRSTYAHIDASYRFLRDVDIRDYYVPDNDFVNAPY